MHLQVGQSLQNLDSLEMVFLLEIVLQHFCLDELQHVDALEVLLFETFYGNFCQSLVHFCPQFSTSLPVVALRYGDPVGLQVFVCLLPAQVQQHSDVHQLFSLIKWHIVLKIKNTGILFGNYLLLVVLVTCSSLLCGAVFSIDEQPIAVAYQWCFQPGSHRTTIVAWP